MLAILADVAPAAPDELGHLVSQLVDALASHSWIGAGLAAVALTVLLLKKFGVLDKKTDPVPVELPKSVDSSSALKLLGKPEDKK